MTKTTAPKPADVAAQKKAEAAAAVAELPAELRTMPYRDLAAKAKEEHAALIAARKAKKKAPATPHVDAMNLRHAAGEEYGTSRKTSTKTAKAEKQPAPTKAGFTPIELRTEKHAGLVKVALKGKGIESAVDGLWLLVKRTEAQKVADVVAAAATAASKVIYDARLLTATYVMVRSAFPKVTGSKRGAVDKLVSGLNAAVAESKVTSWKVGIKLDGTLTFKVTELDGTVTEGGARQFGSRFEVAAAA